MHRTCSTNCTASSMLGSFFVFGFGLGEYYVGAANILRIRANIEHYESSLQVEIPIHFTRGWFTRRNYIVIQQKSTFSSERKPSKSFSVSNHFPSTVRTLGELASTSTQ